MPDKGQVFPTQSQHFTTPKKKPFENIVGKEENAGNQHFLLFPQCFPSCPEQMLPFGSPLIRHLQMLLIWTGLKICSLVGSQDGKEVCCQELSDRYTM